MENIRKLTNIEKAVLTLRYAHRDTWQDKPERYWLLGLLEEICELAFAMVKLHKGPVDWELLQIATIAMNWLEKRGMTIPKHIKESENV